MRLYNILLQIINYTKNKKSKWGSRVALTNFTKLNETWTVPSDGMLYVYISGVGSLEISIGLNRQLICTAWSSNPANSTVLPVVQGTKFTITKRESGINNVWCYFYPLN